MTRKAPTKNHSHNLLLLPSLLNSQLLHHLSQLLLLLLPRNNKRRRPSNHQLNRNLRKLTRKSHPSKSLNLKSSKTMVLNGMWLKTRTHTSPPNKLTSKKRKGNSVA